MFRLSRLRKKEFLYKINQEKGWIGMEYRMRNWRQWRRRRIWRRRRNEEDRQKER